MRDKRDKTRPFRTNGQRGHLFDSRVKKSLKSLPRGLKKSLKSLPKGFRKAANNIKHYKTTAVSVPEWLTLYGDDEGSSTEKRA